MINGQKVWTTSAHHADWGLLLARTDWDEPKHQGLSYFVLDMHQPGVEVHPLRQMNGHASFNQVFFTDAEVPPEMLVSEVGDGWAVATTTLMHERRGADGLAQPGRRRPTGKGRIYEEERAEIATDMEPYKWYPQRAGRVDLVMERAKATGRINDPVVRQEIAKLLIMSKAAEWTARRARAAQEQGRPQGPEGSLGKLVSSHVARAAARVHTLITGADAMLTRRGQPDGRRDRRDPGLACRPARSPAAPTRSSATSSPSACCKMPQGDQRRHQQAVQGRADATSPRQVAERVISCAHAPPPDRSHAGCGKARRLLQVSLVCAAPELPRRHRRRRRPGRRCCRTSPTASATISSASTRWW